jgi:hypothetical protein
MFIAILADDVPESLRVIGQVLNRSAGKNQQNLQGLLSDPSSIMCCLELGYMQQFM